MVSMKRNDGAWNGVEPAVPTDQRTRARFCS
jgi:hypothetical protein